MPGAKSRGKLRQVHWEQVRDAAPGTIWASLGYGSSFLDTVDTDALEDMFEIPEGTKAPPKAPVSKRILLVDLRRAHALSIELAGIRIPMEVVRARVLSMELDGLEPEQLSALIKAVPTDPEKRDLLSYLDKPDADPALLGPVEQVFLQIIQIPRPAPRLKCCVAWKVFDALAKRAREQFSLLSRAGQVVRSSGEFARLLGFILAIGNHLNTSAGKGPASGFHLLSRSGANTLQELANVKGKNKKLSFLHFAVLQMHKTHPGEMDVLLTRVLPVVKAAAGIQPTAVRGWVEECAGMAREVVREVEAVEAIAQPEHEEDERAFAAFLAVMKPFGARATAEVAALRELDVESMAALRELAGFFGEQLEANDPVAHLVALRAFLDDSLVRVVAECRGMGNVTPPSTPGKG